MTELPPARRCLFSGASRRALPFTPGAPAGQGAAVGAGGSAQGAYSLVEPERLTDQATTGQLSGCYGAMSGTIALAVRGKPARANVAAYCSGVIGGIVSRSRI